MACPICADQRLPEDASMAERQGTRVTCRGRINAIISLDEKGYSTYSLFSRWFTVTLYPRKGHVKYLKFKDREELERWPFKRDAWFTVHGCLHVVDGRELLFDVTQVEPVTS